MTPTQMHEVRATFALLASDPLGAASLFYRNLFAADPSLRAMFKSDMSEQGQRMMQMIAVAVNLLDRPERLLPELRRLGRRHAAYGVRQEHYDTVGTVLMNTLAEGLREAFTLEARNGWTALYALVAREMQSGAQLEAA